MKRELKLCTKLFEHTINSMFCIMSNTSYKSIYERYKSLKSRDKQMKSPDWVKNLTKDRPRPDKDYPTIKPPRNDID